MPQCAWHPKVETNVSCPECGRFMCPKDMVDSPVGYKCKECGRARIKRGGVKPRQLLMAGVYGLVAAVVLAPFAPYVPFFILGTVLYGALVGEAARRGGGGHRTWEFSTIAAVCALAGFVAAALFSGYPQGYLMAHYLQALGAPVVAAVYVTSASWFG